MLGLIVSSHPARCLLGDFAMRHRTIELIVALLAGVALVPRVCGGATIAGAWSSASRLTPAEASRVLLRQADGEPVSALELFEAEKYLRSDGGVSASSLVLSDMLTRLLARRAHAVGANLRIRTLPPVLHWLEATHEPGRLRLRGESLQVAVLNSQQGAAATALFHRTMFQDWRLCAGAPCFTAVKTPLRSHVAYLLTTGDFAAPSDARTSQLLLATELTGWLQDAESTRVRRGLALACDPLPAEAAVRAERRPWVWFRHAVAQTIEGNVNQVLCSFHVDSSPASARLTYLVSGTIAVAPSSAARSAIVNNPLSFDLFEESARR
jgi:hypothetical protein